MGLAVTALVWWLAGAASAEGLAITYQAAASEDTVIRPSAVDGETYLFLPSGAEADCLLLTVASTGRVSAQSAQGLSASFGPGEPVNVEALFPQTPEDGRYRVTFLAEDGTSATLVLMFSDQIRSLYLVSYDPESKGREWLEDCQKHERETSGRVTLLEADGTVAYEGRMPKIRGRGNTTWGNYPLDADTVLTVDKKAYQIKLETKADLLNTGDAQEANDCWVLLADTFDGTLLHNRISNDLARELGEAEASCCQPVDLYYDGEYRGLYLLSEKVEVGKGRVQVTDYEAILEILNKKAGVSLDELTQTTAINRYGQSVTAADGVVDGGETSLGGYLLELDSSYYQEETAHFSLSNGSFVTIKNPEHASLSMATHVSELFEDAVSALTHYGTSPETGKTWDECLDAASVQPAFWTNELSRNPDVWYSSTYFWMEEGSDLIHMGPVWDFDLAYQTRDTDNRSDPTGWTDGGDGLGHALCCIPSFQEQAAQFFREKLVPAVDILLGNPDASGEVLHSLAWYWAQESASRRMNDVLWNPSPLFGSRMADSWEENYENLRDFLLTRIRWLTGEVAKWPQTEEPQAVEITLSAPFANVEGGLSASVDDMEVNVCRPALEWGVEREATADGYATWRADLTVAQKPGVAIPDDARVTVNGTPVPFTRNADGSITLKVLFEDPSYRPAEYDGVDYGLVFDARYYAREHPEAAEAAGDDPEALLAYYVEIGLPEGQRANDYFDPVEAMAAIPEAESMFGDSYWDEVMFFIDAGYEDWMSRMGKTFAPEVRAADAAAEESDGEAPGAETSQGE